MSTGVSLFPRLVCRVHCDEDSTLMNVFCLRFYEVPQDRCYEVRKFLVWFMQSSVQSDVATCRAGLRGVFWCAVHPGVLQYVLRYFYYGRSHELVIILRKEDYHDDMN